MLSCHCQDVQIKGTLCLTYWLVQDVLISFNFGFMTDMNNLAPDLDPRLGPVGYKFSGMARREDHPAPAWTDGRTNRENGSGRI